MSATLIDAGPIIAYYDAGDDWHPKMKKFLESFRGQFISTCAVIAEAMHLLRRNVAVQNELLRHISKRLYQIVPLTEDDFARIAELNVKYASLPGDFTDLSLIIISERLDVSDIVSLDADFDIYRRYSLQKFNRIFPL